MKCPTHPRYVGRNKPKTDCEVCWRLWRWSMVSSWAIKQGFYPEQLTEDIFQSVIRHRFAVNRIANAIEQDMYNPELNTLHTILDSLGLELAIRPRKKIGKKALESKEKE